MRMYETIVVPTDGSERGERAVETALELAETYDAALHALFVVDTHRYAEPALSSTELVIDRMGDEGMALLREIEERAREAGVEVETRCCHGNPHEEIVEYAAAVDADVVVVGHHGHGHADGGHVGSVTSRVVRTAGRPVLVA
jgi:nucleotide-binding universal stress UspA family protein